MSFLGVYLSINSKIHLPCVTGLIIHIAKKRFCCPPKLYFSKTKMRFGQNYIWDVFGSKIDAIWSCRTQTTLTATTSVRKQVFEKQVWHQGVRFLGRPHNENSPPRVTPPHAHPKLPRTFELLFYASSIGLSFYASSLGRPLYAS